MRVRDRGEGDTEGRDGERASPMRLQFAFRTIMSHVGHENTKKQTYKEPQV